MVQLWQSDFPIKQQDDSLHSSQIMIGFETITNYLAVQALIHFACYSIIVILDRLHDRLPAAFINICFFYQSAYFQHWLSLLKRFFNSLFKHLSASCLRSHSQFRNDHLQEACYLQHQYRLSLQLCCYQEHLHCLLYLRISYPILSSQIKCSFPPSTVQHVIFH